MQITNFGENGFELHVLEQYLIALWINKFNA